MLSPEGKTPEQLAHEAFQALQRWRELKGQGREAEFEPVLDLKPTPEEPE
jgi:hypothetical protein